MLVRFTVDRNYRVDVPLSASAIPSAQKTSNGGRSNPKERTIEVPIYVAAVSPDPSNGGLRISQEDDISAAGNRIVCGRCSTLGHPRSDCLWRKWDCFKCGKQGHHPRECSMLSRPTTPTNGYRRSSAECYGCGKAGHYKRDCLESKANKDMAEIKLQLTALTTAMTTSFQLNEDT